MLPLIKSIVTRFTRPMVCKQPEPNYDRMDEWAHVELSYWAKHFTKATEMVLKQKNLLLCDVLTISEVNLLWAIAHYSSLAEEGEMVGEAVEAMMLANAEDVESIKKKLEPCTVTDTIVWCFLSELETFQAAIKTHKEAVCHS